MLPRRLPQRIGAAIMTTPWPYRQPSCCFWHLRHQRHRRFTLCLGGVNVDWRVAMAIVMLEGVVGFVLNSRAALRAVVDAIPASLSPP